MSTDVERYARLHAIFDGARRLDEAARDAYLHAQCKDDDHLRAEVEALIAAASDETATSDGFAETRIAVSRRALEKIIAAHGPADAAWLPERIAGYRIAGRLGDGGMGVVYEAIQDSPRRRVAVKLLHPMQATAERLRRLRHEAELLGRLHHPGIAQVYEAGTYDLGRGAQPFFAMELVEGVDLRTYCERQRLDVRDRLDLLARVCDAVDYAHHKGVIHRDLKPDNILVDEHGQPKVLDFGIARTTDGSTLIASQVTQDGQLLGTLAYMAPEQLRGELAAISPRTDVYGLGVVGFELVAGQMPLAVAGLGLATAIRMLQEQDAPRLGTIDHRWRGDVEVVIAHAIEKDPEARYPSAAAFAADLRRYLHDEPLRARPPSAAYRLRKLIRKNRGLFTAVTVVFLSLVVGLGWALIEKTRADRRATELARQSYRANLVVAADAVAEGRMTTARQFLDDAPEEMRGWEWRHLESWLDPSIRRFDEPAVSIVDMVVSADGSRFLTASSEGDLLLRSVATGAVLQTLRAPGVPSHCALSADGTRAVAIGSVSADPASPVWIASWSLADGRLLDELRLDEIRQHRLGGERLGFERPMIDADRGRVYLSHGLPGWPGSLHSQFRESDTGGLAVVDLARRGVVASREFAFRPTVPMLSRSGRLLVVMVNLMDARTAPEGLVLDPDTLETRGRLEGYHDGPNEVAISPDETRMAAVMMDGRLLGWDLAAATSPDAVVPIRFSTETRHDDPRFVVYSADGARLITLGTNRILRIWDAATGAPLSQLPSQEVRVVKIAVVPGTGEIASAGEHGSVRFWAPESASEAVLRGHGSFVYAVDVDPGSGLILTAGWDGFEGLPGSCRLWDLESGDAVAAWGEPGEWVYHATFLPGQDALLALHTSLTEDPVRIECVNLATGVRRTVGEIERGVTAVQPSRTHSRVWLQGSSGKNFLLDPHSGALSMVSSFTPSDVDHPQLGYVAAVTHDDRVMAVAIRTFRLLLVRADDGTILHELPPPGGYVTSLDFDGPGGRLLSASEDGTVKVWDVASGRPIAVLAGHDGGVLCARFSPDGTRIATGGRDATLRIWSGETYEPLVALTGHERYIYGLTWQDDGERIFTASGDHTVRIWEAHPVKDRHLAHRERQAMVEKLTPRIDAWRARQPDAGFDSFLGEASDLTPRERQVARQILLGRLLGTVP